MRDRAISAGRKKIVIHQTVDSTPLRPVGSDAKDDWSPEAREAAIEARKLHYMRQEGGTKFYTEKPGDRLSVGSVHREVYESGPQRGKTSNWAGHHFASKKSVFGGSEARVVEKLGELHAAHKAAATDSAFSELAGKLKGQPGVTDPDGLAAWIGRNKYGAAGMVAKAAAGRTGDEAAPAHGFLPKAGQPMTCDICDGIKSAHETKDDWSPEAREAAIEARKKAGSGSGPDTSWSVEQESILKRTVPVDVKRAKLVELYESKGHTREAALGAANKLLEK